MMEQTFVQMPSLCYDNSIVYLISLQPRK